MDDSAEQRQASQKHNSGGGTPGGPKGRSSRSRRRGRGRRQGNQQHQAQQVQPQVQPPQQAAPVAPRAASVEPVIPPAQERQPQRDGGSRSNRRRPNRRRMAPEPMPSEVLRRDAVTRPPLEPERRRTIAEEADMSEPQFGCPMLTRTRLGMPFRGGQRVPRCSVGWTVHDEDEAWLCMHVPTRNSCWKERPEVLARLLEALDVDIDPDEAAPAAD